MKQTNSANRLLNSVSTDNTSNFKSLMNSHNYGNQQFILQSCCFFNSERTQTPHASLSGIKDNNIKNKYKSGSPKIPYSKDNTHYKNLYFQTSTNNVDKNKPKVSGIQNNKEEYITKINKLKKDNKGLKETIKSLTSQLDRVCSIAEKVKNNEINTLQLNDYNNGQEKNILLSQIDTLTKEKEELKKQVEIKKKNIKIIKRMKRLIRINY